MTHHDAPPLVGATRRVAPTTTLPDGFKMTELGPLPEEWEVVRLGDVVGKTSQVNPRQKPEAAFKYIDVSSVSRENLRIEGYREYIGKDAPSRARKLVKSGDVIFATVRPYLKRVAIVPPELDNEICSTAFCVIRADARYADGLFLFYAIVDDKFVARVTEHQRGSSYPAVTDRDVLNEMIPLPPLSEQRAIARVLSTVRQAIEATERVIAAARELKRSLMHHLFTYGPVPVDEAERVPLKETEIGLVPEGWEVVRLGDVIQRPQYGYTASASEQPIGPKFLRITDIQMGRVDWSSVPHCEVDESDFEKYRLSAGDILFARIGATTGKTYLVEECPSAIFASYLIRVRVEPELLSPEYLYFFTNTELYWRQINASKGGRLKRGINIPVLTSLQMPFPPLSTQREIARVLQSVDRRIISEEARKAALEALFYSLLHHLMTGKVRVKGMAGELEGVQ